MNNINKLQKQMDKEYKVLDKLLLELSEKERTLAYKKINNIIDLNISIEESIER